MTEAIGNITFERLDISGVFSITSRRFDDDRGTLSEALTQQSIVKMTGSPLDVAQVNAIQSRQRAIRGLHAFRVPPGQIKYVVCLSGRIQVATADLRTSSSTFGTAQTVELSEQGPQALLVPPGVASGFLTLSESSIVAYLNSQAFSPDHEYGVHPLDPELAIEWKVDNPVLSPRDAGAPQLKELRAAGALPD